MGTWWSDHPDLEGVARRGRRELIEEDAAAEGDTEQLRKRRRSLVDLCFEWMSRGDHVTIGVGGHEFEGRLVAAVNDLLVMRTKDVEIAAIVTAVNFTRCDRRRVYDGTSGERSVSSFRAYLGAAEIDQRSLRLVGRSFDVTGVIDASTDDHWLLIDRNGVEWALSKQATEYCMRPIWE
jgi:hypothetical protein